MPTYKYKSISQSGKIRLGSLDAANEIDLEKRLSRMDLDLIWAKEARDRQISFIKNNIEKTELIVFSMHMGQLLKAGVPLITSLGDLRDSIEQPRFKEIVSNLIDLVEEGMRLSQAMKEYPAVFDTLFVNLVDAGESSGKLAESFESLAEMLKWQDELNTSTRTLLRTPLIIGTVVLGVIFFLMIYLVPQLVQFLDNMGEELPLNTRVLLLTSNLMVNYWYLIISLPVFLFISITLLIKTKPSARYLADKIKLKLWKIGPVYEKILLSRFANFFSMMYSAGIPILTSLKISEGVVSNLVIREALQEARIEIEQGKPISLGFANTGIFPPLVIRMFKIGEAQGKLDKALLDIGYFYQRDINDSINTLQSLIQPLLTGILGLILGWVMLSVLGPVYGALSSIN